MKYMEVDTRAMERTAAAMETAVRGLGVVWEEMDTAVRQMDRFWKGTSGENHRTAFCQRQKEVRSLLGSLQQSASILRRMASCYTETEESVRRDGERLPDQAVCG